MLLEHLLKVMLVTYHMAERINGLLIVFNCVYVPQTRGSIIVLYVDVGDLPLSKIIHVRYGNTLWVVPVQWCMETSDY